MQYRMAEGTLTLADAWQDQTVNVLIPQATTASGVNLVIARDTLPLGMSFADYVVHQRGTFKAQLPALTIAADTDGQLDDHDTRFMEIAWRNDGKPVRQLVAMVAHAKGAVLTFTCSLPADDDEAVRQIMIDALMSFKFTP